MPIRPIQSRALLGNGATRYDSGPTFRGSVGAPARAGQPSSQPQTLGPPPGSQTYGPAVGGTGVLHTTTPQATNPQPVQPNTAGLARGAQMNAGGAQLNRQVAPVNQQHSTPGAGAGGITSSYAAPAGGGQRLMTGVNSAQVHTSAPWEPDLTLHPFAPFPTLWSQAKLAAEGPTIDLGAGGGASGGTATSAAGLTAADPSAAAQTPPPDPYATSSSALQVGDSDSNGANWGSDMRYGTTKDGYQWREARADNGSIYVEWYNPQNNTWGDKAHASPISDQSQYGTGGVQDAGTRGSLPGGTATSSASGGDQADPWGPGSTFWDEFQAMGHAPQIGQSEAEAMLAAQRNLSALQNAVGMQAAQAQMAEGRLGIGAQAGLTARNAQEVGAQQAADATKLKYQVRLQNLQSEMADYQAKVDLVKYKLQRAATAEDRTALEAMQSRMMDHQAALQRQMLQMQIDAQNDAALAGSLGSVLSRLLGGGLGLAVTGGNPAGFAAGFGLGDLREFMR